MLLRIRRAFNSNSFVPCPFHIFRYTTKILVIAQITIKYIYCIIIVNVSGIISTMAEEWSFVLAVVSMSSYGKRLEVSHVVQCVVMLAMVLKREHPHGSVAVDVRRYVRWLKSSCSKEKPG